MSDLELSMTPENTIHNKSFPTEWLWRAVLPIALVALLLGFAGVDRSVLSPGNLLNIAQQTSYLALFAMAQTTRRTNVILISIDQCQADRLHAYGNTRETSPNLDRMAAEGVRFERFYSAAPWTAPSYTSDTTAMSGCTLRIAFNPSRTIA